MSADDEKPPLDAALRHLAEQQRRSLASHPTPQELAAYHAGELPPEAEARILDHLAVCRECSDLLLDLSGFADLKPPEGMPELTDQQVEQDWQALRARMRKEAPERKPAEVVPIRPVEPTVKPERTYPVWLPVAASLLAVLGFSFGLYQSIQVGKFSRPRVMPVISSEDVERGDSGEIAISAQDGGLIYLDPDPDNNYSNYEADVVREEKILARLPVGSIEERSVPLLVPGPLKPGSYEIRLYGVERGQRKLSTTYTFEAQ